MRGDVDNRSSRRLRLSKQKVGVVMRAWNRFVRRGLALALVLGVLGIAGPIQPARAVTVNVIEFNSTADGWYKSGSTVLIDVTFGSTVTVDAGDPKPALLLNSGGFATYLSGSGSAILRFTYTVGAADTTGFNKLHVQSVSNLGKIKASGVSVDLLGLAGIGGNAYGASGTLSGNRSIYIDNSKPTVFGVNPPAGLPVAPTIDRGANMFAFFDGMEALRFGASKNIKIFKVTDPSTAVQTITTSATKSITDVSREGSTVTVTSTGHGLAVNDVVSISGVALAKFNGIHTVTAVTANTFQYSAVFADSYPSASAGGTVVVGKTGGVISLSATNQLTIDFADPLDGPTAAVTGAAKADGASAAVYTTDAAHSFSIGNTITVGGAGAFNQASCTISAVTSTTFTCPYSGTDLIGVFGMPASAGLKGQTEYFITHDAGLITDAAGNEIDALSPVGAGQPSLWRFKTGIDRQKPMAVSTNASPYFSTSGAFNINFSETVVMGTGTPTLSPSSGTVTPSVSGTTGTITFGTALTANTEYTLTVPLDTFKDSSGNQISGSTPLTYTFGTFPAPAGGGGGGGGATGPCGPPPLPPCFINPGINFGPGGMIQNPGAIGAADMANLRPDNFMGFRPQDAQAMTPGALQNFRPDQFGALPPSAMQGFRPEQITNLNPAALAGMNFQQVKALPPQAMQGFKPDQFAQLPPSAMAGFDPARMQALPPSAMAGFRPEQMAALPPEAMRGFDPTKMVNLPPAALAGLDPVRMAAMPPQAMSVMNPSQFGSMPPAAMEGMRFSQMNVIPAQAMQGFKPDQFSALPPEMMQAFKPQQMAALPPMALSGMEPAQMRELPPNAARALNPQQMTAIPPEAMAAIPPGVFRALTSAAISALTPEQRAALPPQALNPPPLPQAPNANNISQLMGSISGWNIDKVPPAAFTGMRPTDLAKLPNDAFTALSPAQIGAMAASAMQAIKPAQLSSLPPEAFAGFKPSQMGALPAQLFGAMSPAQVAALPAQVLGAMKPTQVGQLPPDAFEAMKPNQLGALPPSAMQAIKPDQFGALPPEAFAGFKPNQMGALPPKALSAIEPEQVAALPPAAVSALKPSQLSAIPAEAFGEMKPTQVAALPPAAVQAIKPEQLASLPPEAMAGMKPTQVAALPPKALAAIEPEQVDALPPQALKQVTNKQVAALPPEAMQALDATQIAAMPSSAFKGITSTQAQAFTPELALAFDQKDLANMPPAVRTIVNSARS